MSTISAPISTRGTGVPPVRTDPDLRSAQIRRQENRRISEQRTEFADTSPAVLGHFNVRPASAPTGDDARAAAEEFISATLIEPILKLSRENNHAAPPFGPTPAEKSFGPMLDAEIARNIVARERYGLVDAVARQLQHDTGAAIGVTSEIDTHA